MEYVVICTVLVHYMSSQKVFIGSAQYNFVCLTAIRRKYFAGTFSACVITNSECIYEKEIFVEASKVVDKPSKVIN